MANDFDDIYKITQERSIDVRQPAHGLALVQIAVAVFRGAYTA